MRHLVASNGIYTSLAQLFLVWKPPVRESATAAEQVFNQVPKEVAHTGGRLMENTSSCIYYISFG